MYTPLVLLCFALIQCCLNTVFMILCGSYKVWIKCNVIKLQQSHTKHKYCAWFLQSAVCQFIVKLITLHQFPANHIFGFFSSVQWFELRGKCGVCGDAFNGPRDHEMGGKYATGVVMEEYEPGDVISVTVEITGKKAYLSINHLIRVMIIVMTFVPEKLQVVICTSQSILWTAISYPCILSLLRCAKHQ